MLFNLNGIQNCTKLVYFICPNNNLSNLNELENFNQLEEIVCYNNPITYIPHNLLQNIGTGDCF
jgi:Leucine-rich repeat (LRR) protein